MISKDDLVLYRKIARLRHCNTTYNKNLDLMYDKDGNPTELRKEINKILYRIATGELGTSFLAGVNSEIDYVKKKTKKKSGSKKKKNKPLKSVKEQVAALMKGMDRVHSSGGVDGYKYKYLSTIGMRPKQLNRLHRKALPYYKEDN